MAEVIYGGNAAVQALIYGDVHPGTQHFFESQRGHGLAGLTQSARRFAEEAVERFGFMASERTQRLIRDVRRTANWIWHGDYVRQLRTVDELQMAAPTMIRYIMAEPTVRSMYHAQQLAGYDEHYKDLQPHATGEQVYEYRQVMEGIVVVDEDADGNPTGWHADSWMDDVLPDAEHEPLAFDEQLDIITTWAHTLRVIRERREDPTSTYGASLD